MVPRNSGKWRLINWALQTHEMAIHSLVAVCKWPPLANTQISQPEPMHPVSTADIHPLHSASWPARGAKAVCMFLPPCALLSMPAHTKVIHSELLGAGLSHVALQSCPHTPKAASSKQGHPCSNLSCFSTRYRAQANTPNWTVLYIGAYYRWSVSHCLGTGASDWWRHYAA